LLFGAVIFLSGVEPSANAAVTPWTLSVTPQLHIPLANAGHSAAEDLFSLAYGGTVGLAYGFKEVPGLSAAVNAGYCYGTMNSPVVALSGSLSEGLLALGAAYRLPLLPWLAARAFASGGVVLGGINGDSSSVTVYGSAEAGAGLDFILDPQFALRAEAAWVERFGLYGALRAGLSVAWTLPEPQVVRVGPAAPLKIRLLDFTEVKLGSIFPIMQTWYDDHPLGSVRVTNTGKEKAANLKVSFLMRQYMDAPKECAVIPELAPGESLDVPLLALFRTNILDVTEATKATAEVAVEYGAGGDIQTQTSTASIRVYDRNAMTWDDDRKAAAFVSGKDPWVLELSNNITAAVRDLLNEGLPANLQTAMAFHAGLRLYGLSYVTNPKNPFAQTFANPEVVDFLKFPRQTLAYKAGDCSDLSILYCAFLESVGIETAFVTVPGHIFMAFDTGLGQAAAKSAFANPEDLIMEGGKAWMPLEVTMRDGNLQDIWREAAREWRQGQSAGNAAFYPIHEAWKTYAPVGLAADSTSPDSLAKNRVALSFENELAQLVDQELARRTITVNETLKRAATPKAYNERGVIYARFGKLAEAEKDFRAASAKADYAPALINLGNIAFLKLDNKAAYDAYVKAAKLAPDNPRVQLNLARAATALGKAPEAAVALERARKIEPALAAQYGMVAATSADAGTRAAETSGRSVLWDQE
jgi:tetratricopeptide (TPR) repeat protein